jgi:hypothetical protein
MLVLGTFAGSASAQERRGEHREYHHNWNGGYYRAPPVVYGSPYGSSYYYPPPVVYGPGIGIGLPGVNIGIGRYPSVFGKLHPNPKWQWPASLPAI